MMVVIVVWVVGVCDLGYFLLLAVVVVVVVVVVRVMW